MSAAATSSLCGPSNALTALQKYHGVDRSLQQDRLRAGLGSSSSQNFRSAHPAANLNHEFEQFSGIPQDPHFLQHPQSSAAVPNWAAEFQRLTLNTNLPSQSFVPRAAHAPPPAGAWAAPAPIAATASSWHAEFLRQQHQPKFMPAPQQQQQAPSQFIQQQQQYRPHSPMQQGTYTPPSPIYYDQETSYSHAHFADEQFEQFEQFEQLEYPTHGHETAAVSQEQQAATDAAFDLAFAEASRWSLEESQHDVLDAVAEQKVAEVVEPVQDKGKGKGKESPTPEDHDELSRTAGQLLESVAMNRSKKFQESNFLALMRKLRDREVQVEGGEMVQVGTPS